MTSSTCTCITVITLFFALTMPVRLGGQPHTRYRLVDLGTFGGPTSSVTNGGLGTPILNNRGMVTGTAETSTPDPYAPNCSNLDCFVSHTFRWQRGVLTDLGALPGVNSSFGFGINELGWIAGSSGSVIDPLTGVPQSQAVLWKDGQIINLGTLGGNGSTGIAVNNRGQVAGFASNAIPDPFSGVGVQVRTFLWENGVMQDLGTLGGPNSPPVGNTVLNERGQVAGASNINSTPNPATGIPTTDPFLWENGKMIDLGTLGGTVGSPASINNRGQVAGLSNLAGDSTAHAFRWDRGTMMDLGTLGGTFGLATWINDVGEVVGAATNQNDQAFLAFLWKDGAMTNLGTLNGDCFSIAEAINSGSQVVGRSGTCDGSKTRAFLWENGSMIDLNTLVPANSSLQLVEAININAGGEIAGMGTPPGVLPNPESIGNHVFLLVPCGANDTSGCDDNAEATTALTQNSPAPVINSRTTSAQGSSTPGEIVAAWRTRMMHRHYIPGSGTLQQD